MLTLISSRQRRLRAAFAALALTLAALGLGGFVCARAQTTPTEYARLNGKQKILFDGWARRQNASERVSLSPAQRYAALSVSQRTTFEAVTNALSRSRLTNSTGRAAGFAIDAVAGLEEIAGQEEGKGGDKEFRLYVRLAPGAIGKLEASREFSRGKDNTVFHSGYPINYRQDGKTPTIQFSITKEGDRADIDVDYRSSHFPAALFNGHLTAANSDVRPPRNYRTHISRWLGLIDWWDMPAGDPSRSLSDAASGRTDHLPLEGHPDADEARAVATTIDQFLDVWLIRRDTEAAMKFVARKATVCANVDADSQAERLSEKQSLLFLRDALREINRALAQPRALGEALVAVEPHDRTLKLIDHMQRNAYALASITDGHYEHFVCNAKSSPATSAGGTAGRHGAYYLSLFRLKLPNAGESGGLILLWTKESDGWKLGSFDVLSR